MNIAILSRNASLYSTKRLCEAATARGHDATVVDYLRCYMNIVTEKPAVHYRGKVLVPFDAVIPRIGSKRTFYGTAIVRQFETSGTFSVNSAIAITRSRDKLRSLQLLSRQGVGLPKTGFANSVADIDDLISAVGGAPLVIKLIEGTQGVGVVLAETTQLAESVIQTMMMGLKANIIVQEYIQEANGADIRCFVVGDQVVAAMKRQASSGEFRSNLHRGGSAQAIEVTSVERETAVQAARIMGLKMAGVDLLRSKRGPLVMEVNSSPGLEGIETATQIDIADLIIAYIEKHAKPISRQCYYEG